MVLKHNNDHLENLYHCLHNLNIVYQFILFANSKVRVKPEIVHTLINDFENPVFEKYPAIKNIKEELYSKGAAYAAMSGSGSTVYGIFEKEISISSFTDKNYFAKILA